MSSRRLSSLNLFVAHQQPLPLPSPLPNSDRRSQRLPLLLELPSLLPHCLGMSRPQQRYNLCQTRSRRRRMWLVAHAFNCVRGRVRLNVSVQCHPMVLCFFLTVVPLDRQHQLLHPCLQSQRALRSLNNHSRRSLTSWI